MDYADQQRIFELWTEYLAGLKTMGPHSAAQSAGLARSFYLEVIKASDLYRYGVAFEVLDILANGPFEIADVPKWQVETGAAKDESVAA